MKAEDVARIEEALAVPGWPGVYVLGCLDRRVTIYSQQVRALNLAAMLFASGKLGAGDPVAVIGAGAAGLTCAAGLDRLGAAVTLLEAAPEPLHLFSCGAKRWLHPRVYDWPSAGWEDARAGLPVLDWAAGTLEGVHKALRDGWKLEKGGVDDRFGVREVSVEAPGAGLGTVTWNPGGEQLRCKVVVLAVGFGLERRVFDCDRSYWESDDLDERRLGGIRRRWLVSGCGDGALTDLFRLCLDGFKHEEMLAEFASGAEMAEVIERIEAIEGDATLRDRPDALHDAYRALQAPGVVAAMRKRLRADTEVALNAPTPRFLTADASVLNRFLTSMLRQAGGFDVLPGKLASVVREGERFRVKLEDGREPVFDRVVRRHGPVRALETGFPAIWAAVAPVREARRVMPTLTDGSRAPLYGAVFGAVRPVRDVVVEWGGLMACLWAAGERVVAEPESARSEESGGGAGSDRVALRRRLVELYPERDGTARILGEAGFRLARFDLSGGADDRWFKALGEVAKSSDGIDRLRAAVEKDGYTL